jgi:hypothetical protein
MNVNEAKKKLCEYSRTQMLLAFEYGYKQCEKGNNIEKARSNFLRDMDAGART